MELSLIIPVWNDQEGLDRLLRQVDHLGVFSDIVIVDDASEPKIGLPALPGLAERITLLRCDTQRGAGHARNLGLQHVRGSHVIFFDLDDLFGMDFLRIIDLAREATAAEDDFDFLIFRHDDSRITSTGASGSFPAEERLWQSVGASDALAPLAPEHAAVLCRLSAYPWNKIYSTNFLRAHDIRCTETMVHNDIELHWSSFIAAKRILHSVLIGAEHFVIQDSNRLTNRRSAERLEVFRTFANVLTRLKARSDIGTLEFLVPFMRFAQGLMGWVQNNIDEDHHQSLQDKAREFCLSQISREDMTLIAYRDPALARRLLNVILKGKLS